MYIVCVYKPTQDYINHICTDRFNWLEEDICMFKSKGRVLLLGDFNARVGKSSDVIDVVGMFGEDTHVLVIVMVIYWLNYSIIVI